ncbi:MAG: cellulase family glycosylhydrolase, partial [Anaerolineaceae bacterium]|nr:cellulase family glycosylhydrolase [Anaerolineaceae bacterium]
MTKTMHGKIFSALCILSLCFVILSGSIFAADAPGDVVQLHVEAGKLADPSGEPVQLRGVSTHGLTWFPDFVSAELFRQLSEDWGVSLIRLAMYSDIYTGGEQEESLKLMRKGIDAAVGSGLYVLVDWHILEDGDPNQNIDTAIDFFGQISAEYAGVPNLLYEICNEPNGTTNWGNILEYSSRVIPVIRANSPEAVVIVGTPDYDQNLSSGILRPVPFDNVMYALHFYSGTHYEDLFDELIMSVNAGLPVFITECGLSESSGDGKLDFGSAADWFQYLNENRISYAVWSFSNKSESSALLEPDYDPDRPITDEDLTPAGFWVREAIRGTDPDKIPVPAVVVEKSRFEKLLSLIYDSIGEEGFDTVRDWWKIALGAAVLMIFTIILRRIIRKRSKGQARTYDDLIYGTKRRSIPNPRARITLTLSGFFTLVYLVWRICFSIPGEYGTAAVAANLILLAVEIIGFLESLVLYDSLIVFLPHPLPKIMEEEYPDVDVFVATYNEPPELLRRTLNGCKHMLYPDLSKVHIWLCDDNRREEMRSLAIEMGVGYFDRPDNKGAKAGNLNHAMSMTNAPYIVTLDADMIPKSDFLLKTIPYFVDAEKRNHEHGLGLLQTPQSFYQPDVFQFGLYSEKRAPNEQDFFYRTIEPAKTSTNSVIYGGSNTVLSRKALEDAGGFYTESITEDFATGLLIESAGYLSLALSEPLASGQTPQTFREHIQQRTRWARGVIAVARKLKIWQRKDLTWEQKVSYWSSVSYWYSPLKNLVYALSPLMFVVFALPVFKCTWLELLVFWLPMFLMQDINLLTVSRKTISQKWAGIYEMSVMPSLLIPILKETFGLSLSVFKVTDKSGRPDKRGPDYGAMIPFIILALLSAAGILSVFLLFDRS